MRIDQSLDFAFRAGDRLVEWDKGVVHSQLGCAWQFGCSCAKCPRNSCKPKKRDSSCVHAATCRAHPKDGLQAVDVACLSGGILYLIEVKDFGNPAARKPQNLSDAQTLRHYINSVAKKFRDTVFAIWCGSAVVFNKKGAATADAIRMRRNSRRLKFVFHVELPKVAYASGLYSKGSAVTLVNLKQALDLVMGCELSRILAVVDMKWMSTHPTVFPWTVSR